MSKLRRVGEQIGYGYRPSNEDLARVRMAEMNQRQMQAEQEREMMLAEEQQRRWAISGATRAPRNPFTAQTEEEYEQYSPYDVNRNTVRRMDDATDFDFGHRDLRIAGMPNGMHIMDDVSLLEDILMESIEDRKQRVDSERQQLEASAMREIAWEEAQLQKMGLYKDDGTRLSGDNMTSGRITRTANETDSSSGFGIRDYSSMERARENHQRMLQNTADRKNSIQRKFASNEERRQEMFDRENQRSRTVQDRFAASQTLGNLSDRLQELGQMQATPTNEMRYSRNEYDRAYGPRNNQQHNVSYV